MHLDAILVEFRNALKEQNRDKISNIFDDQEWMNELNQLLIHDNQHDFKNKDFASASEMNLTSILDKCKVDIQLAFEFLTLLKLIDKSKPLTVPKISRLECLKEILHNVVDSSNIDINLYDLSFLGNSAKPKQAVLGKPKKVAKKYPNIPTSALAHMDPECWSLDEDITYLDAAKGEKRALKIHMLNGRVTRGPNNEEINGSYKYVVTPKGGLYAMKDSHRRKHSSIRAGQPVIGAGHIIVKDGKIVKLNADSGHYAPPAKQTLLAAMILKEQKMIDDYCIVDLFGHYDSLGYILSSICYSKLVAQCHKTLSEERLPNREVLDKLEMQKVKKSPSVPDHQEVYTKTYLPSSIKIEILTKPRKELADERDYKSLLNAIELSGNEGIITKNAIKKIKEIAELNATKSEREQLIALKQALSNYSSSQIAGFKSSDFQKFIFIVRSLETPPSQCKGQFLK